MTEQKSLYCDNYKECNSYILYRGTRPSTVNYARAKGWHVYDGVTQGGAEHHGVLCAQCVDTKRRALKPVDRIPGEIQLFEIVIETKES